MNPPIRFLHELSRALAASSLYGPQHPARYKAINTCYEALRALQADDEEPSFSFLGRDVVYGYEAIRELQDWEWSDRFATIGVQRIEVTADVTPDDFAIFIEDVHARLIATANGGTGTNGANGDAPSRAPLQSENLSRQTAIRFGPIGVQGATTGGGSTESATIDVPFSLDEESEAIRYIHSQVASDEAVPLVEAEAVVRSLSGALHSDGQMLIPLLKLKSFDQYTTTHSINVSVLSMALAEALGNNARDVRIMGVAGLLHDLGKVRVPPEILSKPGSLSPEERELLERHPSDGARIILNSDRRLTLPAAVAFEHHIMINGGGYPRRHFARDCHYASTLVHVCDVYDALHTDRPYRAAWPSAKALHYIERRAEREFDPAVAGAFIALMRKNERGLDITS
jgi:putative nucleotidyltransferase with HDIG domain